MKYASQPTGLEAVNPVQLPSSPVTSSHEPAPPAPEYEEIQELREARRHDAAAERSGQRTDYEYTQCPAYAAATTL